MRIIFRPPLVEPAQPPIAIKRINRLWESGSQVFQSEELKAVPVSRLTV